MLVSAFPTNDAAEKLQCVACPVDLAISGAGAGTRSDGPLVPGVLEVSPCAV